MGDNFASRQRADLALPRHFYDRPTLEVAHDLVGCYLHRRLEIDGQSVDLAGRITETEGYLGPADDAAHSARGYTHRTRAMFGPPGHAYIYFIYGMHWCINAVAGPVGNGEGVLIRGMEPATGIDVMRRLRSNKREFRGSVRSLTDGPGKLCQALGITGEDYGTDLTGDRIFITPAVDPVKVARTPRIGIPRATTKDELWRFVDADYVRPKNLRPTGAP